MINATCPVPLFEVSDVKVGYPTLFQLMRNLKGMTENNAATTGSFTFINLTVVWCLGVLFNGVPANTQPEEHGREQCRNNRKLHLH